MAGSADGVEEQMLRVNESKSDGTGTVSSPINNEQQQQNVSDGTSV